MSEFYSDLDDIMKECLADFDCRTAKLILVRHIGRVMNATTRELDVGSDVEIEFTGITIPLGKNLIDGTAILEGDIRVVMDSDITPIQGDDVKIDGDNYGIVRITPFNAGGVVLGYDLQVRR